MIKISKYEAALVIITVIVFFGGLSSAYFILHDLREIHEHAETNRDLIEQVIKNLEGNVTVVNQTVAELTDELTQKENIHPYSDYETEIFQNLTNICYPQFSPYIK